MQQAEKTEGEGTVQVNIIYGAGHENGSTRLSKLPFGLPLDLLLSEVHWYE